MFGHSYPSGFRIGRNLIFAIVATTIFLLTTVGSHAAVFSFLDSVKEFLITEPEQTIFLPQQPQPNGIIRSDGLPGLSSTPPILAVEVGYHNVTISSAASSNGSWSGGSPDVWTPIATGANVGVNEILTRLNAGTSVVINTAGGGSENGDIILTDGFSWGTNVALTLSAYRNVKINCSITATGNMAGLTFTPSNTGAGGIYSLNNNAEVTLSGSAPSLTIAGNSYVVFNEANGGIVAVQGMNGNLSGHYALGSNIDATSTSGWSAGAGFLPIGDSSTNFTGTFDGLGHTITGLTINRGSTDSVGLFGYTNGAAIRNVGLVGGAVSGGNYVGGLVGYHDGGASITNSYNTGGVSGTYEIGGLVGINGSGATVTNAYSTGSVTGTTHRTGGLVGGNWGGTVSNSYATGSVWGGEWETGGLVGGNRGAITNSYATGSVYGGNSAGGLAGLHGSGATIVNSYSTGAVTAGTGWVGGLVGNSGGGSGGTITNSYWDTQTSGKSNCTGEGSGAGCTGLTTVQMKQQASFTGWDFTTVWSIDEDNSYPQLRAFLGNCVIYVPTPTPTPACSLTVTTTSDVVNSGDADNSLREAIICANTSPGADTINIPADTYTLSISGQNEDVAATGDLDITGDLTLIGAGAGTTIIDGNVLDRVFEIGGTVTASISDVTIRNGKTTTYFGGGILNSGTLTVTNSTISGNTTEGYYPALGGGVFNFGTLTVTNSNIDGNTSAFEGGGIYTSTSSTLNINNSSVSGNNAYKAGGIFNWLGTVTITNSTVSGNTSSEFEQAGGIFSYGWLTVTNSTISGNVGVRGGGIGNYGVLTVTNSTVTGNSATIGGGIANIWNGGGIPMTAAVTNSTISGNSAGTGGGMYQDGNYAITLANTIVANQTTGSDCSGAITSNGNNLESSTTCGFTGAGDLQNSDPLLGPLQDNGGLTFTHGLLAGSPAIDVIPIAVGGCGTTIATDQRGISRPQGPSCDIGAFELVPLPPTPTPTPSCDAPRSGLVSWWPGEGNANDIVGTNNGTMMNGASFDLGRIGQAFRFDGNAQYVDAGGDASLKMTDAVTVAAWINSDFPGGYRTVMSDHGPPDWVWDNGKILRFSGSEIQFLMGTSGSTTARYGFDGSAVGQWQHLAATYDGSYMRLYVNGTLVDTQPRTGPIDVNGRSFRIGGSGYGEYFAGLIDEPMIYNRALSAEEVQVLVNAGTPGVCAQVPQLKLVKAVINDNGGTLQPSDWNLTAAGGTDGFTEAGQDPKSAPYHMVTAGVTYTLSESGPYGYTASPWECVISSVNTLRHGTTKNKQQSADSVTLSSGETAVCTITNDDNAPQLRLVKEVINNDAGTAVPNDWDLTAAGVSGGTYASGENAGFTEFDPDPTTATYHSVNAGITYKLSEAGPLGYSASGWRCNMVGKPSFAGFSQSGDEVTLSIGDFVSCTITNDDDPTSCVSPPSGMVSWWPGEGNTNDIVSGHNGTPLGGLFYTAAKVGQGFTFDSEDDRIMFGHDDSFNVQSPGFTADFWIYGNHDQPYDANNLFTALDKNHGFVDSTGWVFTGNSVTGTMYFAIGAGGPTIGNFPSVASLVDVLDGRFHHIAGTWDGTAIALYVDGVFQGSTPLTEPFNNTRSLNMGFTPGFGTPIRFFKGTIDEVEIFSRALSQTEIAAIYSAYSAGKCHDSIVQFSQAADTVPEPADESPKTLTVTRTGALDTELQVGYSTESVTATGGMSCDDPGVDFEMASGVLTFPANGPASQTFDVTICDDTLWEGNEDFKANLSSVKRARPTGVTQPAKEYLSTETVTIIDDDTEPTCVRPPDGMVSWWPGDGDMNDIRSGHNGLLPENVDYSVGIVGKAFTFDGDDAVEVPDDPAWDFGANDFTIDTWFRQAQMADRATQGGPQALVAHDDGGGFQNKWIFWLDNGQLQLHYNDTGGNIVYIGENFVPEPGYWYHLAVVRSGANYRFYVNGAQIGDPSGQNDSNVVPDASHTLTIGMAEGANALDGSLDEVEIFNRALTADEVRGIYNARSAGKCKAFYTLTVSSVNGTVTRVPDLAQYLDGSTVQLTAAPAIGYAFVNWTGDIASANNPVTVTMDASKSVTANFSPTTPVIVATHFVITAPSNVTAGIPFNFTVTAVDDLNNVATDYGGTVHFTSTDQAPTLPANATLVNGVGTFGAILFESGVQTIDAYDLPNLSIGGTSNNITVGPGTAYGFRITAPANVMPGVPFNFTVTGVDAFGNPGALGSGMVVFTSTDGQATLPANSLLTNGSGTFSATLRTPGGWAIIAKDISLAMTGTSNNINVASLHFAISAPATATAGSPFNFTVTAQDHFNNTATGYTGTVHFTSTDGSATLPGDNTLTNGVGTFSATLRSLGSQTITGADPNAVVTGTSNGINVQSPPVTTGGKPRADFDGDGRTDVSVFRPSEGNWYIERSSEGYLVVNWGLGTDTLVPGDYDGDGKADFAVFRPTTMEDVADFYVLNSNGFVVTGYSWGLPDDIPMTGDYDGDGKIDITIYRPSTSMWWIWRSSTWEYDSFQFGSWSDVPMVMDFNGDGKTDLAVYRPSERTCYMNNAWGTPAENYEAVQWGLETDIYVPADYDGDGRSDIAVFRPDDGTWYILRSSDGGYTISHFGKSGDVPVPGDYDGDGIDDLAVYRNGMWYLNRSSAGFSEQAFGLSTDEPVPAAYYPYEEW